MGEGAWGWDAGEDDAAGELIEPALPEVVDELARQRLQDEAGSYAVTAVARTGPGAGSSAYVTIQLLPE